MFLVACGSGDDGPSTDASLAPDGAAATDGAMPDAEITCADLTCAENAVCDDADGSAECVCLPGFSGDGINICVDLDECDNGTELCDDNADCTNTPGSYICDCFEGYAGDGMTCTDLDECTTGADSCDANATCTNTEGSFTCACNPGYEGDGMTCVPGCTLIEGLEGGVWPAPGWMVVGIGGYLLAAAAHDGSWGLVNPGWHYKTGTTIGAAGDKLSAWARIESGVGGRVYLGFDADAAGAKSLVMAPQVNQLLFQDNAGYLFTDLTSVPQSYTAGAWYRMEIEFLAGNAVIGRLFSADGTTMINSVSHTFSSPISGQIAVRAFGTPSMHVDTFEFCR